LETGDEEFWLQMSALSLTDNRGMSVHAPAGDAAAGGKPKPASRFGGMALASAVLAVAYASVAVWVLLHRTRPTRPEFDSGRECPWDPRSAVASIIEMNDQLDHARENLRAAIGGVNCYARGPALRNPFERVPPATEGSNADPATQPTATTSATPTTRSRGSADGESRVRIRIVPKKQK
jgi:hypothetical protein